MPGVVLLYHRVEALRTADPARLVVSEPRFHEQLEAISQSYRFVRLRDMLSSSRAFGHEPVVVLSFDDAYRSALGTVPLLERAGIPATFFVPPAHIGSQEPYWWDELAVRLPSRDQFESVAGPLRRLRHADAVGHVNRDGPTKTASAAQGPGVASWDELRNLDGEMFDIGCHGLWHDCFAALPVGELRRTLRDALALLRDHGIDPIRAIAYPYGSPGSVTMDQVREAISTLFQWGFLSGPKVSITNRSDPLLLPRCYVSDEPGEAVVRSLSTLFAAAS